MNIMFLFYEYGHYSVTFYGYEKPECNWIYNKNIQFILLLYKICLFTPFVKFGMKYFN